MVKKVTITDREYRLLKRTNSAIQKNVNFLEAENKKNRFYYDCLWECYRDCLKHRDALNRELNGVHHQLYDETYNSRSLRYELDELNKKYNKLNEEHQNTLLKLSDTDTETDVKEENLWTRVRVL